MNKLPLSSYCDNLNVNSHMVCCNKKLLFRNHNYSALLSFDSAKKH